jgi:hypothetical protein
MIAPLLKGASVLCLGYPDLAVTLEEIESMLGVKPTQFTEHGQDHGLHYQRLAETVSTFMLAGAEVVDCVDKMPSRGCERVIDLNEPQVWPRHYSLVINPGTTEHCFDIATATFNSWRAVALGGVLLNIAPVTMLNHGFWNVCPTAIVDFAEANGGKVESMVARDKAWQMVKCDPVRRGAVPAETVMYALVIKMKDVPDTMPTQWRYRQ